MAAARWRLGTNVSILRNSRVWSRAVMRVSPQIGSGAKRVMWARWARRTSAGLPTTLRIAVAASLSERRITRESTERWPELSGRSRTPARLR